MSIGHAIHTLVNEIADNRVGYRQRKLAETIREYWQAVNVAKELEYCARNQARALDDERKSVPALKTAIKVSD